MKHKITITLMVVLIGGILIFAATLSDWIKPTDKSSEALAPDHSKRGSLDLLKTIGADDIVYLSKNGNRYCMGPINANESNNIGLKLEENSEWFYTYISGKADGDEATINYIISLDNKLPVPVINEKDLIMGSKNYIGENLKLIPVKFTGYSPLIYLKGDGNAFVDTTNNTLNPEPALCSALEILPEDAKGELGERLEASEWLALPYEQKLQVYWDDRFGSMAHVLRTSARYSVYQYNGKDDIFTLASSNTEYLKQIEYQVFNLSELTPGYYALLNKDEDEIYSIFYRADN